MKWKVAIILLIILLAGFFYVSSLNSPYTPMGRLGFVKILNPDMSPGNPHSELVAQYAKERGSNTVLVVHLAGHRSGYPCYYEGDVYIMELGLLDKGGYSTSIKWDDVIQGFLFGIPDSRYEYVSDGIIFENLTDALDYLDRKAAQNGQVGPRLMFWHGTVRNDNPILNQGCGLPLYYKICEHYYGRFGAYYYTLMGMIFPYLNSPYRNFEIMNSAQLQYDYNHGLLGPLVVD
ncbi:MAG: hypothetical protein LLF83_08995 [Methanobacterium sp.]|nr:hypothetical protein [Methanobacterium sp.]